MQEPTELEKSKINLSKRMLVVVTRSDMYVPAKITSMVRMNDSIEVHYILPPLGNTYEESRVDGICTYVALEIRKTDLPFAFKKDKE
jgi:hypothetical protein